MKHYRKLLIIMIILLSGSLTSSAQYYFYNENFYENNALLEAGASIGTINCLTDIGGNNGAGSRFFKDVNPSQTHLNGSLYFGVLYKYQYGLRVEASLGSLSSADSVLKGIKGNMAETRYDRNLNFRTNIQEISLLAELYPTFIFKHYERSDYSPKAAPYCLLGVGLFHFNPQAYYKGNWIDLQPLHLEGQGFSEYPDRPNYKLTQLNFPLGAGVKYEVNGNLNLRAEFIYRFLKTDYLDDCSKTYIDPSLFAKYIKDPLLLNEALALNYRGYEIGKNHDHNVGAPRGRSNNNDAYFTLNIKAGFVFGRRKARY